MIRTLPPIRTVSPGSVSDSPLVSARPCSSFAAIRMAACVGVFIATSTFVSADDDAKAVEPTAQADTAAPGDSDPTPEPTIDAKAAAGKDQKPAAGTDAKPAAGKDAKPAAGDDTKPAAANDTKPAASANNAKPNAKPQPKKAKPEPAKAVVSIFADEALEDAVRAEVFAKRYTDEPITKEDVARISRVVGVGKKITSLQGLEHCKELMLIDLRDNAISDLTPISNLKRLQSVSVSANKIKNLSPLKELTAMQLLDLSDNKIEDLEPIAAMSNLRTLYVAKNRLSDIAVVAKLPKLWSLDVANNKIRDLRPVRGLSWLTTLEITGNQVDTLEPLTGLRELDMLLMARNAVTDLSPLVQMCQKDAEGERRFAPYLQVYLGGNPIDEKQLQADQEKLESYGVDVFTD